MPIIIDATLSRPITVSDGLASLSGTFTCDDESNEKTTSLELAHLAVLQGIGELRSIPWILWTVIIYRVSVLFPEVVLKE